MEAERTRHAVFNITYRLVWCPKYRRKVLTSPVAERLDQLLRSNYVGTAGEVSAETIRRYIEAQRGCRG